VKKSFGLLDWRKKYSWEKVPVLWGQKISETVADEKPSISPFGGAMSKLASVESMILVKL